MTGLWNAGSLISITTLQASIYAGAQWDNVDYSHNTTSYPYGYVLSSYPTLSSILAISYYDDYTAPNLPSTAAAPIGASTQTRGLPAASLTNILGTTNMLWSVSYYDDLGRLLQGFKQHNQGGGAALSVNNYDVVANLYNFTNTLKSTTRTHHNAANPVVTVINNYSYDHRNRRITNQEQINGGTNVIVSKMDYNELGQLLTKHLHSETGAAPFLQYLGYTYNERGWLRTAGTTANPFYFELKYDNPDPGISKQYNGNIAEMLYTGATSGAKTFSYSYDQLNRLTNALSTGNALNETLSYDLMGNITALTRTGGTNAAVLAYTYQNSGMSNQLTTVTNGGNAFRTYPVYDNNGNAQSDGGSKTINYNLLNLPQTVTQTGTTLVTYTYTAAGEKLRSVSGSDGSRDYIGGIEYHNNTIEYIETEEGRATPNGGLYHYSYNLKDQLGNVRVTFDKSAATQAMEVVQEDEYYSFGLRVNRQDNSNNNHYLYNGKEVQADLLNQYDYGARFYDPVIARWNTIDPLAEKSRRFSSYNYVEDNPIRNIDPDGMMTEQEVQDMIRKKEMDDFANQESGTLSSSENQDFTVTHGFYNSGPAKGRGTAAGGTSSDAVANAEKQGKADAAALYDKVMKEDVSGQGGVANQGGGPIDRILFPNSPSIFNLKKIGEAYYTNLTYEENFYDFRIDKGHFGVLEVDIPSINIMVSARDGYGRFISMEAAKVAMASALYSARWDVLNEYLNSNDKLNGADAGKLLIKSLNIWLNVFLKYGNAYERTPAPWIGSAKSTYINLWP